MSDRVGIVKTLCKVQGSVKHTSIEGTSSWKTGNLELAQSESGQVVCIVNYTIGPSKKFVLTNQIRGVITNQQRCVINLKNGTNINYLNKNVDSNKNVDRMNRMDHFNQILEELKHNRKDNRHSTTTLMGIHSTPNGQAFSPVKQSPGNWSSQKNRQRTKLGPSTPRSSLQFTPKNSPTARGTSEAPARTSPNPMTTPSHLRSTVTNAENGIYEIKDEDDSSWGKTEFTDRVLFTDMPFGDKENVGHQNYRIPKHNKNEKGKSAFQMRREEGGSVFMASFQEKQLLLEERKENTAPKPVSNASKFYSSGRQCPNYSASDALLQPRQTNSNVFVKRTPGFLNLSHPKRAYPITTYPGWRQKSIPTAVKTSQISLQGFSNLGNTCYMNAILQSLFGLDCFTADMQNQDIIPLMQKSSLYWALAQLLCAKQSNQSAESIGVYLRKVKQAISTTAARFSGFMQHDAQEFLCQCLDQLKEDTERANKRALNSPVDENSGTDEDKLKLKSRYPHPCPIVKNFEFEVMHSITCKQCGEVVTKAEQFYDLSLDMPRRSNSNPIGSVQTALEQFFREEGIEYTCGECDCKQATVTHKFTKLPRVIIVHLKRYKFDADAFQYTKLRRRILIPRYLSVHYHCTKETQSPISLPKSLVNGTSSPRQLLNAERTQRLSLTAPSTTDSNWSSRSQSFKPSRFSFTSTAPSRKRLNYDDTSKQSTVLLDSNTDSDGDDTKRVLEMSKQEAERKQQKADERLRREEEELKKVLEESKQEIVQSKPIEDMSEEQQLAYALALSSTDMGSLNHQNGFVFPEDDASKIGMIEDVSHKMNINAKTQDIVEISDEEVVLPSLKRRGSETEIPLHEQGCGDGVHVDSPGNTSGWKRRKSDNQPTNHSSPTEHPLSAGDSGIGSQDKELKIESSRTPSSQGPLHRLRKNIVNMFSPIKKSEDGIAVNLDNNHSDTPKSRVKFSLVDFDSPDISRNEDHKTLQIGESDGERPSYEELKAKEEEELRKATELSLQDAQEMAKEEEDALKRAKEISLQEFSESFSNSPEDNDHEPMEIDDDSDETLTTELSENAENGHLPSSYRLVSVVSHMGSTSSIGHYISDVYNRKKNSWLSYDDSRVIRTSESAVREERERSGYIFFYIAKS